MDLRTLRYFVAVVDEGGITRAARVLFVSQPSLSLAMRRLEDDLGVRLLDRSGGRAAPTADGARLAALARQVIAEADGAAERVRQVTALEVGRLVVATSTTLAVHPLTPLVAALRGRHPGLEVHVRDAGTAAGTFDLVRSGEAELGVVDVPPPDAGWGRCDLGPEEIVLAASPEFAAGLADPVARARVAALDLGVVPADLDSAGAAATAVASMAGRVRARCAHRAMLWELVGDGTVATFVGRDTAASVMPWAALRSLDPPLWRDAHLVWREQALSPAGAALVELAELPRGRDEAPGDR
ncbi:LysR family transcriptional regulator [Actinomadura sp. WMMB 499]|uniref:LysR family transcriptional regulator n=1 Tax=Actinomadura sp. WMMB 499 TaxID=1219491 RepID=UPI001245DA49|nr:LysR family transcriptional regulator [Actinomadura sp. WMMB 499]QFG21327.1 LysR family transcriptional regulator [Actinomadura sp. WMMB 499]